MILAPHASSFAPSFEAAKREASPLAAIADASLASLSRAIYDWLAGLKLQPLDVLQSGARDYLTRSITGAGLQASQNSIQDIFTRIVTRGGQYGVARLERVPVRKESVGAAMSFTMLNPEVTQFIEGYMLNLIVGIATDTRKAISLILLDAFTRGGNPRQQARLIEPLIGLTSRQAQAVINYRNALETGNYRATLDRALRDGRYDARVLRALKDGSRLTKDQIDQMVRRYAERSLRARAVNIARTETILAANAGLRESWRQANQQGLLPETLRQHWLVATDERTCPNCKRIPGMNSDGVPMGGQFQTPYGPVDQPPAHPQCRCALGLR